MKKASFWDKPLRYKISLMTLLVAVIPFTVFFVTVAALYERAYQTRNKQQIKEDLQVMSDRIEKIFEDTVLCSNYITLTINSVYDDHSRHQVDIDNSIKSVLNQSVLIFDGLDSVVYISKEGDMYSTKYSLYNLEGEIKRSSYMKELKAKKNGTSLLFDMDSKCMCSDDDVNVVTMGKRIVHIKSGETLGFLFVNVDLDHIEKSMGNTITSYFLFDSKNQSVAHERDSIETDLNEYKNSRKYLVVEDYLTDCSWRLVGVTDLNMYNVSFLEIMPVAVTVIILTLILLVLLSIVLTRMVTKPLKQLEDGAQEIAKGNMDLSFDFKHDDEIGRLGNIFNYMTKEIAALINRVDEEAKKRSTYELALVQEQVKPHFLYNTLDIIIMLIEMNKPKDASRVTKKLADYYKTSLSSSADIVTIEKELRIIEDYLDLQLMRYKDMFSYDISLDETLSQVLLPKMTLQPLVENAIYHGLKYKEGWGNIAVKVYRQDGQALIEVSDNGVGMTEKTYKEMMETKDNPDGHFGVYSVIHRLQLYYGSLCKVDVSSKPGLGTKFEISIPINWEGRD